MGVAQAILSRGHLKILFPNICIVAAQISNHSIDQHNKSLTWPPLKAERQIQLRKIQVWAFLRATELVKQMVHITPQSAGTSVHESYEQEELTMRNMSIKDCQDLTSGQTTGKLGERGNFPGPRYCELAGKSPEVIERPLKLKPLSLPCWTRKASRPRILLNDQSLWCSDLDPRTTYRVVSIGQAELEP